MTTALLVYPLAPPKMLASLVTFTLLASLMALVSAPAKAEAGQALPQLHAYKQTPQGTLQLVVHNPADWRPGDSRPAILFFYGGGFWTRNMEQFKRQAEYFANRGLVTVLADYRTGERHGTRPPAAFEDARSAMRWIRLHAQELGINPERIAASGGSAGGSLAASLDIAEGLDAPEEKRDLCLRPNLLLLYNPALSSEFDERTARRFGDHATWAKTAAALHASSMTPPTLLLYGAEDTLLAGGRSHADKLRSLGVTVSLQITAGAGHGFFNLSPHLTDTTRTVAAFLESHGWMKPSAEVPLPEGAASLDSAASNPERGL